MYQLLLGFAALLTGWTILLYAYRITLHPLAKFPGPKLAAVTRWYEFYYDVVLKGQFVFHLPDLHKRYGPIIRISPEELHIDDPDFFATFYAKSGRLHKHARDSHRFGNPNSVFTTADANVHRIRRTALNPYFSKRKVMSFQNVAREKVVQMLNHLRTYAGTNKPLNISLAYMALTGDMIMQYCFGYNFNHVESKGFETNFHEFIAQGSQSGNLAVHFPIVMKILVRLPVWFVVQNIPSFAVMARLLESLARDINEIKKQESSVEHKDDTDEANVVQHLLRSDMPPDEKSDARLLDEMQNFIGAGVSTTGWALSVATFHIARDCTIHHKLREELQKAIPDAQAPDALEEGKLEQCEYLTACVKEAIRLAYAVSARSVRLSDNMIQYETWQIPPRTPVSMTTVDISHNEDIFPESRVFKPERWLGDAKTKHGDPIEKYWVGFGRGSRNCLGINLAWLELYITLAGVIRNFDLELFETDESDVMMKHDFMIPTPKLDSKGIRVMINERLS